MRTGYFITMDTHCRTTDACVKTARGKLVKREHMTTNIPSLRQFIESVPRPRHVAFEEGALAGWLYRHLREVADEMIVSVVCGRQPLDAAASDRSVPCGLDQLQQ